MASELEKVPERSGTVINDFSHEDESVAQSLGIVLSGTVSDYVNRAVVAQNSAATLILEAGYLLLKAHAEAENGHFLKMLKEHGVENQRAYELMKTAKFYTSLPEENRRKVFSIGKTKLQLLASADPEVIQDFLDDPSGDVHTLSVRDLRQRLRDMESSRSLREKRLEAEIEYRDTLIAKMKHREKAYQFLPQTHHVREECLAYQAECELALNSIWALFEDAEKENINEPEWRLRTEQIWITAHVVAARAADMLDKVRRSVYMPDDMPTSITSKHILTDDEASGWLLEYPMIERKHETAKATREQKRIDSQPKGPGRPRK